MQLTHRHHAWEEQSQGILMLSLYLIVLIFGALVIGSVLSGIYDPSDSILIPQNASPTLGSTPLKEEVRPSLVS